MIELIVAGVVSVIGLVTAFVMFRKNRSNRTEQDYVTVEQALEKIRSVLHQIERDFDIEFVENSVIPTFDAFVKAVEIAFDAERRYGRFADGITKEELVEFILSLVSKVVGQHAFAFKSVRTKKGVSGSEFEQVFAAVGK